MTAQNDIPQRTVYIVSDGTGITAEALARSILSQFDVTYSRIYIPFVDTLKKAQSARLQIQAERERSGVAPIVFSTLVIQELVDEIRLADALHLDVIQPFVEPLSQELGIAPHQKIGLSHQNMENEEYQLRMEAINFTLAHDDGISEQNLEEADVILVGVSRSGKTPTSLYLAMQYGLKVANYPLIPEDFERNDLPQALKAQKHKLFGLTIQPERLSSVRNERRPNSHYASLANCRQEVMQAERMMLMNGINYLSSTSKSIEEISTAIVSKMRSAYAQQVSIPPKSTTALNLK
ncbi:MAG: kinase/pyrophosphorylase [Oxalobacter sp.]|nr:kinase/pyrophosphorylase [Oxalobacter sp.]